MKQIKIGDRFKLCGVEWSVIEIVEEDFLAAWSDKHDKDTHGRFPLSGVDFLEWIEPEVTFTEEQIEAIAKAIKSIPGCPTWGDSCAYLIRWFNEHKAK